MKEDEEKKKAAEKAKEGKGKAAEGNLSLVTELKRLGDRTTEGGGPWQEVDRQGTPEDDEKGAR
ncbi:hypothetical protein MGYG_09169 [Nannizzia gypsea CBS 118893]|uniref:Uncharacterized protein n=1 Tax=Arthroderma gypseum (strain ATCC MYA-4604 / CBS 118893) TaxID=535722 RepID=E4V434_ARTGP|nr:hypothetical protein MGYG_09169 [Nannizzia gypsea CBS 118893]EFR04758.1 hypothetical protein MGYG_09169 [Nannizzia gypsea CBS 118893]